MVNKRSITLILILLATLFTCSAFAFSNKDTIKKHNSTILYANKQFKFSVEFPSKWSYKISDTWKSTPKQEANPDGGITINIESNKGQYIYVYGQYSQLDPFIGVNYKKENFKTSSGLTGILYKKITSNKIEMYLIFDDEFHSAHAAINTTYYKKHSNQVLSILKSINF